MKIVIFYAIVINFVFLGIAATGAEIDEGIKSFQSARYSEALKILVPLANSGNAEAQRIVGEMCYNGQGMKRDVNASFQWSEIAAKGENKIAQYNVGYLYEKGEGVAVSRNSAIEWYTKAALQGHVAAQHKLGDLYSSSDREKAIHWYKEAGESGDEAALGKFATLSSGKVREKAKAEAEERYAAIQKEKERQEEYRREKERKAARDAEDQQSSRDGNASLGEFIQKLGADNAAYFRNIDRQTNAAINESNRVRAAQAAERERARVEKEEREAERRREAERARTARADAQRTADAKRVQEEARNRQQEQERLQKQARLEEQERLQKQARQEEQERKQAQARKKTEEEKAKLAEQREVKAVSDYDSENIKLMKSKWNGAKKIVNRKEPIGEGKTEAEARLKAEEWWPNFQREVAYTHERGLAYGRILSRGSTVCTENRFSRVGDNRRWLCSISYTKEVLAGDGGPANAISK